VNEDFGGIDLSGLGAAQDQLFSPSKVLQFEGTGSDEMHTIRKRVKLPGHHNRPNLGGEDVDSLNYIQAIVGGFTRMYQILLKHRDELLSNNGPLDWFAEDKVRTVIRPTRTYGLLLAESFHPDLLRDALARERHFDRLWVGIEDRPYLKAIIPAEHKDLWRMDIPVFFTSPNSCDLWTSSNELIADFFNESSLSRARRRLQEFSEEDIEKQTWFIRASFTTSAMEAGGAHRSTERLYQVATNQTQSQSPASREQLLAAAWTIGDRLEDLALRGEQDASWIGLSVIGNDIFHPLPLAVCRRDGFPPNPICSKIAAI